jgi:hypothetical protein
MSVSAMSLTVPKDDLNISRRRARRKMRKIAR